MARDVGPGRRRRPDESGDPLRGPRALADGRRSSAHHSAGGHAPAPDRDRGHRRRDSGVPERRPGHARCDDDRAARIPPAGGGVRDRWCHPARRGCRRPLGDRTRDRPRVWPVGESGRTGRRDSHAGVPDRWIAVAGCARRADPRLCRGVARWPPTGSGRPRGPAERRCRPRHLRGGRASSAPRLTWTGIPTALLRRFLSLLLGFLGGVLDRLSGLLDRLVHLLAGLLRWPFLLAAREQAEGTTQSHRELPMIHPCHGYPLVKTSVAERRRRGVRQAPTSSLPWPSSRRSRVLPARTRPHTIAIDEAVRARNETLAA